MYLSVYMCYACILTHMLGGSELPQEWHIFHLCTFLPNSPSCITAPLPKVGQIFWAREKTEGDEGKQKSDARNSAGNPHSAPGCVILARGGGCSLDGMSEFLWITSSASGSVFVSQWWSDEDHVAYQEIDKVIKWVFVWWPISYLNLLPSLKFKPALYLPSAVSLDFISCTQLEVRWMEAKRNLKHPPTLL